MVYSMAMQGGNHGKRHRKNDHQVDLGFMMRDTPNGGKLKSPGPLGTMCAHCIELTELAAVGAEAQPWLRNAYDEAG